MRFKNTYNFSINGIVYALQNEPLCRMMGIVIKKIIIIIRKTFVILRCTPVKFFKDFLRFKICPLFRQTIKAAAAFNTLCFPIILHLYF